VQIHTSVRNRERLMPLARRLRRSRGETTNAANATCRPLASRSGNWSDGGGFLFFLKRSHRTGARSGAPLRRQALGPRSAEELVKNYCLCDGHMEGAGTTIHKRTTDDRTTLHSRKLRSDVDGSPLASDLQVEMRKATRPSEAKEGVIAAAAELASEA